MSGKYPVTLNVKYPERLSKILVLIKLFAAIPHLLILEFYGVAVFFAVLIAFFYILFTGRYPKDLFDFVIGYWRWRAKVNVYLSLATDEYPPFSGK